MTSPSVKSSHGAWALATPSARAWGFPSQPGGNARLWMTSRVFEPLFGLDATPSMSSPVRSPERSSTATICARTPSERSSDPRVASIESCSLQAGTMTVTSGTLLSGNGGSWFRSIAVRSRTDAIPRNALTERCSQLRAISQARMANVGRITSVGVILQVSRRRPQSREGCPAVAARIASRQGG